MESKKVWKFSEVTPSDLKWAERREITATVDGNAGTVTFSEEVALPSLEENWDVGTENDLHFDEDSDNITATDAREQKDHEMGV